MAKEKVAQGSHRFVVPTKAIAQMANSKINAPATTVYIGRLVNSSRINQSFDAHIKPNSLESAVTPRVLTTINRHVNISQLKNDPAKIHGVVSGSVMIIEYLRRRCPCRM